MHSEVTACGVLIAFCFFIEIEAFLYEEGEHFFHNSSSNVCFVDISKIDKIKKLRKETFVEIYKISINICNFYPLDQINP